MHQNTATAPAQRSWQLEKRSSAAARQDYTPVKHAEEGIEPHPASISEELRQNMTLHNSRSTRVLIGFPVEKVFTLLHSPSVLHLRSELKEKELLIMIVGTDYNIF